MNSSKQKNSQRGFTLVEVIVVAIIVAALAGVAIPMYTSYVKTSHTNAAANAAGSVASFMGSCLNQTAQATNLGSGWTDPDSSLSIKCFKSGGDTLSSMQLPRGIAFKFSSFTSNGEVQAHHKDGGDTTTYKY